MNITIRPALPVDRPGLLSMISALAAHHGDTAAVTDSTLDRDVFGHRPWYQVIVAADGAALAGYAALLPLGQLQFGRRGMDLHHLFVGPGHRRMGIGKALIAASIAAARNRHCDYLMVGTHEDNTLAQAYYRGLGFAVANAQGTRFVKHLTDAVA